MQFEFIHVPSLPALAWCARLNKGETAISLFHGSQVEIRPDAFVEGAWDGDFAAFHFLDATVMSGTGGCVDRTHVRFAGSHDRLSPLFSVGTLGALYVSNSLIFAMSASGEEPDPIYPYYGYDLVRIWRQGLFCLHGTLPLRSGRKVGLHFGSILKAKIDGTITLEPHHPGLPPNDYTHFRSLLDERVKRVLNNAQSPERKNPYRSLAALSQGYDSTATAILARDAGCREVVTLLDSREPEPNLDSGLANARRLGMDCQEVDRWSYVERSAPVIAELMMFAISCDTPIAGFEDLLRNRIFVSGHFGDTIWDPVKSGVCANLSQTWARFASGVSTAEFRLRAGFLSFAPTNIMARHHQAIHRITHSASMRPWWVEGDYNRPIARRIIENAGLPRGSFASNKRGGGHAHFRPKKEDDSPAMENYREFLSQHRAQVSEVRAGLWHARVHADHFSRRYLGTRRKRIVPSSPLQRRFPFILNCSPINLDWSAMFTLQWAHTLLAPGFRLDCEQDRTSPLHAMTGS